MLFALSARSAVGSLLGTRCRLLPLIAVSAFVATSVHMVLLASGSEILPALIRLVGLVAVLQAWYLVGAQLRVSVARLPSTAGFHCGSARCHAPMDAEAASARLAISKDSSPTTDRASSRLCCASRGVVEAAWQ
jgi:hypothetical protein